MDDLRLGFPPSLFGGNWEILKPTEQAPCPFPTNSRLIVANLSSKKHKQVLVINPTKIELELNWERNGDSQLSWTASDGISPDKKHSSVLVPPRGWLLGVDRGRDEMPSR